LILFNVVRTEDYSERFEEFGICPGITILKNTITLCPILNKCEFNAQECFSSIFLSGDLRKDLEFIFVRLKWLMLKNVITQNISV